MFTTHIPYLRISRTQISINRTTLCSIHTLRGVHPKIFGGRSLAMPPKRKRSSVAAVSASNDSLPPILPTGTSSQPVPIKPPARPSRQSSRRGKVDTNPEHNADIVDGVTALRASPDADEVGEAFDVKKIEVPITPAKPSGVKVALKKEENDSALTDIEDQLPEEDTNEKFGRREEGFRRDKSI
jgi:hypothetical protein